MNHTMKFAAAVMTILLGISLTSTAQTQTKKLPQKITSQTATTDDGRKAILKSDGTWKYATEGASGQKLESTLTFETGLVFLNGDTKPVARTTFYLLDSSLAQILSASGKKYFDYSWASSMAPAFENYEAELKMMMSSIKPHIVQMVTTDFGGKATFKQVPPGKYYLMGFNKVNKNALIWDNEVTLSPGSNSLTLDQNNAAYTQ